MKKKSLLFLIMLATLCVLDARAQAPAGCQAVTTYYPHLPNYPGILHEQYYVWVSNQSIKQGLYKIYSQKGVVLEEGNYNKGNKIGKWTYRDENNALATVESFDQNGLRDGEYISYENDDKDPTKVLPTIDAYYKNGKKDGDYKAYYTYTDDGFHALREDDVYQDDTVVAATKYTYKSRTLTQTETDKDSGQYIIIHSKTFYPDGKASEEYQNIISHDQKQFYGNRGTETRWFDSTGIVGAQIAFSADGKNATYKMYYRDGKIRGRGCFELMGGNPSYYVHSDVCVAYYPNGAKQSDTVWHKDMQGYRRQFCDTSWYDNGKISELETYKNDSIGHQADYYNDNNSQIHQEGDFKNGQPIGNWKQWNENGSLEKNITVLDKTTSDYILQEEYMMNLLYFFSSDFWNRSPYKEWNKDLNTSRWPSPLTNFASLVYTDQQKFQYDNGTGYSGFKSSFDSAVSFMKQYDSSYETVPGSNFKMGEQVIAVLNRIISNSHTLDVLNQFDSGIQNDYLDLASRNYGASEKLKLYLDPLVQKFRNEKDFAKKIQEGVSLHTLFDTLLNTHIDYGALYNKLQNAQSSGDVQTVLVNSNILK